MGRVSENFGKKDFWVGENLKYAEANFRHRKCARLISDIAHGEKCDLLDLGCGPATLRTTLPTNVNYHGMDIAIHQPAPYLLESDFVSNPITFKDQRFDVVVALGLFEYLGRHQAQKFAEINGILKPNGKFILSFLNFGYFRKIIDPPYNNFQSIAEQARNLQDAFHLERCFPAYYHWRNKQPGRFALPGMQMHLNWNIPFVSSWLAIEYFFVCSHRE